MKPPFQPIRDCYPCDGRGLIPWFGSWHYAFTCRNCNGSGVSPTWAMSDGSDPAKRPVAA
jgi:hypothetical protein